MLVLDSGAVTGLAVRTPRIAALIMRLRMNHQWPPRVPSVVLVECLQGHPGRDARNAFLKTCDIVPGIPETMARRAATLRRQAHRGSAVDALVVVSAEPGGTVLTSDPGDLSALAEHSRGVVVERL
jgi:hypothetical protein